jgi:hypothetical protein
VIAAAFLGMVAAYTLLGWLFVELLVLIVLRFVANAQR